VEAIQTHRALIAAAIVLTTMLAACSSGPDKTTEPAAVTTDASGDATKPSAHESVPPSSSTPQPGTESPSEPTPTPVVQLPRKASYGHYFAANYTDAPADVAMLCEQAGVSGVLYRRTWRQVEPAAGVYDFSSFDAVLDAIANSHKPDCQLWLMIEFKSFASSPQLNPCPVHLQQRSAPNSAGGGAATCFMWENGVRDAYLALIRAAAKRYDQEPRVEGLVLQESALGFSGNYSQDVADGGTYTAVAWRDSLIALIQGCGNAFRSSRCMAFANFLRNGQAYLHDVSAAIASISDNRGCLSGPDLLPDERPLYETGASAYEVLTRHAGCRANSAQNDSFEVTGCGLDCIFRFAVSGTLGDFAQDAPRTSGVCVNAYLFWNHRLGRSATGMTWLDALPVIAAHPYGVDWLEQCNGGGGAP
jgi:hypothetical protein